MPPLSETRSASRVAFVAALALAAAALASAQDEPRGCAIMHLAERTRAGASGSGLAARTLGAQAATLSARTLHTAHFAIHYTLAPNVHRVRLAPEDAALKAKADSIRATLSPGLATYKRDSTVHARLDSLGQPHPKYVLKAAEFFERAWEYYDSLGLRMPSYASVSGTYIAPSQGRYVVDIVDLNVASGLAGAYYGLAWPPGSGGYISLENDFLYAASYQAGPDSVAGTPVRSFYPPGTVYRNYAADWEMGLKVTAAHEFYHAVQYAYVPVLPLSPHAWYELSATAMEERLAPEVNDYLQYLPSNIPNNHRTSLFVRPPENANYGNGIFHTFLARSLGADFDVAIWERLGDTTVTPRNNLPSAIGHVFGEALWDSLYAAYAATLAISGTPEAGSSPLAFSPDMAEWPKPRFETVPDDTAATLDLPALTFRLVRPPATGSGVVQLTGLSGGWRVDSTTGPGYQSTFLAGTTLPIAKPSGAASSALAVANSSFGESGKALLARAGEGITPLPNPVTRGHAAVFFLVSGDASGDTLRIVSESGRRVADLVAAPQGASWSWDLKDPQGRRVPPGVYFYGISGQAPHPLLILP